MKISTLFVVGTEALDASPVPTKIQIRSFCAGEEAVLRAVFHSSVHQLALHDYSPEQLAAWAPVEYDEEQWKQRIRGNKAFVAEIDRQVAGYADIQDSGYIDQFYVGGAWAKLGVGTALMNHIHALAQERGITELWSNVSLTAQPFFAKHGFVVEAHQTVTVRGVSMCNARMRKRLIQ